MNGFKFTDAGTLAILVLVIMAFCGDAGQYLAMAAALVWLFAKVLVLYRGPHKKEPVKAPAGQKPIAPQRSAAQPAVPQPAAAQPAPKPVPQPPRPAAVSREQEMKMKTVLLRHINCRITEQLQGAYPGATWHWETEEPSETALRGGCARIRTVGTGDRNYADVRFDLAGHIKLEMLSLIPLEQVGTGEDQQKDPDEVNLRDWYELSASAAVRATIDEVYTRGHKSLYIDEDGVLYVLEGEERVKQGKLEHLPGKKLWAQLIPYFDEDDITATVTDECIALTWAN